MKKLGMLLTVFALLGLATPVFACGGNKAKSDKTAEKKQDGEKDKKKAENTEEDSEEPS